MTEEARAWWNACADEFQDNDIEVAVAFGPGAPLGDVEGTRAIELGCGGGQFGLALADRGADVTGVDLSEAQLEHAREHASERDAAVDFVETSVTDLGAFADASFELAFSAFALQWVEDLDAGFAEAYRVLEPGGRLVYSVDHPFYKTVDPDTHRVEGSYRSVCK